MSIHTFTRDGAAEAASCPADAPVVVLGHGGGSAHWARTHPLAQWALRLAPTVHSLQLPFHGSDAVRRIGLPFATDDERRSAVQAALVRRLHQLLEPLVRGRYVIFAAYSTSAICLLKLFRGLRDRAAIHPHSMLLCIGSALRVGSTQPSIRQFWQTETFESSPAKRASMQRLHTQRWTAAAGDATSGAASSEPAAVDDESWRNCVHMVRFATGHADSGLFTTPDEWKQLFSVPLQTFEQRQAQDSPPPMPPPPQQKQPTRPCARLEANYVLFVQGSNDEPFPPDECIVAPLRAVQSGLRHAASQRDLVAERVRLVPDASHFGYFVPAAKGGCLEGVVARLDELVRLYGETDLLRPWRANCKQGSKSQPSSGASCAASAGTGAVAPANAPSAGYASPPCYAGELQHIAQSRL